MSSTAKPLKALDSASTGVGYPLDGSSETLSNDGGSVGEQAEMGPIDYVVVEWKGRQPDGQAMPHLIDLVDRGLIRILDLAFVAKGEDGSVARLEITDLGGGETAAFAD